MKHWQETGQIVDHLVRLARDGRRCALATVTRIVGSAYRRPGAKLLIEEGGAVQGGVSGGCLEEDVRQVGLRVIESGRTRLRHYATGDDDDIVWGLGLGCNGEVDIAVQPVVPESLGLWTRVRERLQGDEPFRLAYALEEGGPGRVTLLDDPAPLAADRSVFVEFLTPPPRLLVCGAGDDARPLVAFATAAGFRVFVADPRAAYLTAERFPDARGLLSMRPTDETATLDGRETSAREPALPSDRGTYAVVMTHSLKRDCEWVGRLLATGTPYIGLLGPRGRTERILDELGASGSTRVFGPVGLDLGADGPEQVAISILSELLSVWSGRELRHLREREAAVHVQR